MCEEHGIKRGTSVATGLWRPGTMVAPGQLQSPGLFRKGPSQAREPTMHTHMNTHTHRGGNFCTHTHTFQQEEDQAGAN